MPHGGLHWAKGGPIIRRRLGNLSPLKGAHLSPNRWSTACGRGYILSPLRGSLGCVKYVDAPVGEGIFQKTTLCAKPALSTQIPVDETERVQPTLTIIDDTLRISACWHTGLRT